MNFILFYVQIVVLHVGTHNTDDTPQMIADGIMEIIDEIQKRLPNALVIVLVII